MKSTRWIGFSLALVASILALSTGNLLAYVAVVIAYFGGLIVGTDIENESHV